MGFLVIAAIAVVFADYATQAKTSGSQIGSYSLSEYTGSVQTRIDQASDARDKTRRQAELAKTHLPEAPEGWQRRSWTRDVLAEQQAMLDAMGPAERAMAETVLNGMMGQMDTKQAIKAAKKQSETQIWEYVRGDEVIRINAKFSKPEEARGIQGIALEMVSANMGLAVNTYKGYGVIQGVPFFERPDISAPDTPERVEDTPRQITLHAFMGEAITLKVDAHASDEALRQILNAIDFDSLNLMLDTPLLAVGRDAPELTAEQEQHIAAAAVRAHFDQQMDRSRKAEEKLMQAAKSVSGTPKTDGTAQAKPSQAPSTGIMEKAGAFFDSFKSTDEAAASGSPSKVQPQRLKLSGGRSCLDGSAGSFCNN
jgi:hypothetical protein